MRWSQTLIPTQKETPADAQIISHQLLVRAGFIRQLTAGAYDFLPLGLRSLMKAQQIVREEMNAIGAAEVLLPTLQPLELWQQGNYTGTHLVLLGEGNDTGTQLVLLNLLLGGRMPSMARKPRVAPGGLVYHVLNRSAGNIKFLGRDKDFQAFENLLIEAHARHPIQIFAYCLLGTHWHFVVLPEEDGDLTAFFRWLTHTHAMRWRVSHRTVGYGHLYQGRFKSFPVQQDGHFLDACRYVERNALAAGLARQAQDWRWGSLWARANGSEALRSVLSPWPVARPANWLQRVNEPIEEEELQRLQASINRGQPLGSDRWMQRTIKRLHLEHTVRSEGRPATRKKKSNALGNDN